VQLKKDGSQDRKIVKESDMNLASSQKINRYNFEKISSNMGKTFGTIKKGGEEEYSFFLMPMESNLMKINRIKLINNGRRIIDAVRVCLFKIDGYINKIEYDLDAYLIDDVSIFVKALLMSFDPFVNKEIMSIVSESGMVDFNSAESLRKYFKTPVMCLLRIEKSVELWTKEFGVNGYFEFIEKTFGAAVQKDDKMSFAISADNIFSNLNAAKL